MAISTKKRQDLKSYFVKNAIPTEGNFAELIDAQLNQADDGVFKLAGEPLSVVAASGDQQRTLRLYANYPAANPDWFISLKPAQNPADAATTRSGFGVTDGAGNTRLFIDSATGNLGIGTNNPQDTLNVNGDLRLDGGRYRRIKVISDSYWAGIELVARNQGEAGRPHIDFTHGELENPNYGLRLSAESNTKLTLETLTGDATFNVRGNITASGLASANGGVNVGDGNLSAHVEKDGAFYRLSGQAYITVDDNLYIRDMNSTGASAFAFATDSGNLTMAGKLKSATLETGALTSTGLLTASAGITATGQTITAGTVTGGTVNATTLSTATLSTTGNVGIGTATTADMLHIKGGDLRIEGGRYRRIKVISDSYWAGIELVARNQGDSGRPHLDFTHGELDSPNYGIRVSAESNTQLNVETLTGDATLKIAGLVTATAGVVVGDGNLSTHVNKDGAFYRFGGQAYIAIDDNLYIRDTSNNDNTQFHFSTTNTSLRIGDWTLQSKDGYFYIKKGTSTVARFGTGNDRFQVYKNVNGTGPYFYYNQSGNYDNYDGTGLSG